MKTRVPRLIQEQSSSDPQPLVTSAEQASDPSEQIAENPAEQPKVT